MCCLARAIAHCRKCWCAGVGL